MNRKDRSAYCDEQLGVCGLDPNVKFKKQPKPIELYTFIDPLCADCWAFEPLLKKLQVEYGDYFRVRTLVAGRLEAWNRQKDTHKKYTAATRAWNRNSVHFGLSCDGPKENGWTSPYLTSLSIKAAELQGPQAGARFLRKLREYLFLKKEDITKKEVILKCADEAGIDCCEFKSDLSSEGANRALLCDIKTTSEMGVDIVPTFVFFNNNIEDEGLKVSGNYPYYVYVQILEEMLGFKPIPSPPLTIESFLKEYDFVATVEVAVVFNLDVEEAERRLKKLVLQQKIEAIPFKQGLFWKYIGQ